MQSTKSEILLNRILKNVGLINTAPYLYTADVNPYSTKTERLLYLIELHTRGLGPLLDDIRLNKEFYFENFPFFEKALQISQLRNIIIVQN